MIVLGIESSCDETSVALLETPSKILADVVASQDEVHAPYGGVVPELASRRHMEKIVPLTEKVLKSAGLQLSDIDGIAVTRAPGLIGSLLVGVSFAKALGYSLNKPIVGVNHLEGHLNAAGLENEKILYPHIGLVVSGGHTSLYLVKKFGHYKLLGATRDDAAGEAFDKVAKLLNLGYPGGPVIDKISKNGDSKRFRFTRPKLGRGSVFEVGELDFSFSGIKTAVITEVKKLKELNDKDKADLCASFQATVVDIIVNQVIKACEKYSCRAVTISGGVAANKALREKLKNECEERKIEVYIPSIKLCTDNASMIAYVGGQRLLRKEFSKLDMKTTANEEIGV